MTDPGILVVVPCMNEAAHLDGLLDRLRQDPGVAGGLIVVADGGSTDGSQKIVEAQGRLDDRVRLVENKGRIQSAGVNGAVRTFGEGIDAHSAYPVDYCASLRRAAEETGADSVVVAMKAAAHQGSCFQVAAATAQNSALGTGGSAHRAAGERKWIDHGHHALFRTALFVQAGGYDEAFSHNEDAELDARLAAMGGRILLAGDLVVDYFPRTSARALFRQYFMFGRGRAHNLKRHRMKMKLRQAIPVVIGPMAIAGLAGLAWAPLAIPAILWLAACLGLGALLGFKVRQTCAMLAGVPAAIMHFAWSLGFWSGTLSPAPAARLGLGANRA